MRRIYKLFVLCILLICQQHIVAQSYDLGKQKQSFAYQTLYANQHGISQVVKSNNETINPQPTSPMASPEDIQKCEQMHKQIIKLRNYYSGGQVFKKYNNIYQYMPQTHENILNLQKIQYVFISYLNNNGNACPNLEKELKNAPSTEAEIAIFSSYYKE